MGLDSVELVLALEEHFGVEISDEAAADMRTPGDVYDYVVPALEKKRQAKMPDIAKSVAWRQIVDIVVEQLDVSRDEVTRDARFVEDLGMS